MKDVGMCNFLRSVPKFQKNNQKEGYGVRLAKLACDDPRRQNPEGKTRILR